MNDKMYKKTTWPLLSTILSLFTVKWVSTRKAPFYFEFISLVFHLHLFRETLERKSTKTIAKLGPLPVQEMADVHTFHPNLDDCSAQDCTGLPVRGNLQADAMCKAHWDQNWRTSFTPESGDRGFTEGPYTASVINKINFSI